MRDRPLDIITLIRTILGIVFVNPIRSNAGLLECRPSAQARLIQRNEMLRHLVDGVIAFQRKELLLERRYLIGCRRELIADLSINLLFFYVYGALKDLF